MRNKSFCLVVFQCWRCISKNSFSCKRLSHKFAENCHRGVNYQTPVAQKANDAIHSRTRTATGTRFNLNVFSRILKNYSPLELHSTFFSPEKLARLFFLKEVKPSPDCKMIKLDNLFFAKTRSRMRTTIAFFRQNDAGSCART